MERTNAAVYDTEEDALSQALAYLRWAQVVPWFLLLTVCCGTLALLGALMPWRRRIGAFCERTWARGTLWAARCPVIVECEPGATLPEGGFVYAANHQSILDILALFVALRERPFVFAAKRVLFYVPIIGWHLRAAGYLEIDRQNRTRAVATMQAAAGKVQKGAVVMVYPEGTRSRDGSVLPFKKGAFLLALQAQVPIVPVAVEGAQKAMRKHTVRLYGHPIRVRVGAPIPTTGLTADDRDELLTRTRRSILAMHRAIGGPPSAEEPMMTPGSSQRVRG
jgi:1-acyl-sn-glycerol-3-phosphate acyltransferase